MLLVGNDRVKLRDFRKVLLPRKISRHLAGSRAIDCEKENLKTLKKFTYSIDKSQQECPFHAFVLCVLCSNAKSQFDSRTDYLKLHHELFHLDTIRVKGCVAIFT